MISKNPGLQTKTQGQETGGEKRMEATACHREAIWGNLQTKSYKRNNPAWGRTTYRIGDVEKMEAVSLSENGPKGEESHQSAV